MHELEEIGFKLAYIVGLLLLPDDKNVFILKGIAYFCGWPL